MDYRKLNAVSVVDAYPMPGIDDLIDLIGQARFISILDLTKGYWQVPVVEEDKAKTAFATPFGLSSSSSGCLSGFKGLPPPSSR